MNREDQAKLWTLLTRMRDALHAGMTPVLTWQEQELLLRVPVTVGESPREIANASDSGVRVFADGVGVRTPADPDHTEET